jgi:hypothetical protein
VIVSHEDQWGTPTYWVAVNPATAGDVPGVSPVWAALTLRDLQNRAAPLPAIGPPDNGKVLTVSGPTAVWAEPSTEAVDEQVQRMFALQQVPPMWEAKNYFSGNVVCHPITAGQPNLTYWYAVSSTTAADVPSVSPKWVSLNFAGLQIRHMILESRVDGALTQAEADLLYLTVPSEAQAPPWDPTATYTRGMMVRGADGIYTSDTRQTGGQIPSATNIATWTLLATNASFGYQASRSLAELLGLTPGGLPDEWVAGHPYGLGSVVARNGKLWISLVGSNTVEPSATATAAWSDYTYDTLRSRVRDTYTKPEADARYLGLAGGTLTGPLTVPAFPPPLPGNAIPKSYADSTYWHFWSGTQAQFDALPTKDAHTLYAITG